MAPCHQLFRMANESSAGTMALKTVALMRGDGDTATVSPLLCEY